jgi:hypothetical protein
MVIKKGIKVIRYLGNEYAQGACIQVPGGEKIWIGNIYMPPT